VAADRRGVLQLTAVQLALLQGIDWPRMFAPEAPERPIFLEIPPVLDLRLAAPRLRGYPLNFSRPVSWNETADRNSRTSGPAHDQIPQRDGVRRGDNRIIDGADDRSEVCHSFCGLN